MSSLNGEVILADQSIGDALQLRIFGDEFYARRETLDGYTVIYDTEQRRYCYATLAVGRFVSAGIPVYKPAPRNLRRHLKEDPDVRNEKFGLRYARIRPPEEDAETALMRTLGADGGLLNGRKLHRGQIQVLTSWSISTTYAPTSPLPMWKRCSTPMTTRRMVTTVR